MSGIASCLFGTTNESRRIRWRNKRRRCEAACQRPRPGYHVFRARCRVSTVLRRARFLTRQTPPSRHRRHPPFPLPKATAASTRRRSDSTMSRCGRTASTRRPSPATRRCLRTPPTRNLRPNQDPVEQTRPRHLDGSTAAYSLVDIRDGQNVIDWFPGDHPPMPSVVAHGPARMGNGDARMRLVSPAEREGTPGKRRAGGAPRHLLHAPDPGLSKRPAAHRGSEKAEHQHDDRTGESHDRRRAEGGRGVLRIDEVDAMDPGGRDEPRAEDADRGQPVHRRPSRRGPSRSPAESSKCRRTRSRPRPIAIPTRDSSRTCRSAASRRARIS